MTSRLVNRFPAIWISDLHLGTIRCKARPLLHFLREHHADRLYLAGDIVDGWNVGPPWYWDAAQSAVVNEILSWRRRGTDVIFIPGNHDEEHLDLVESLLGPLSIANALIHKTAAGKRALVVHGHQFDGLLNPTRFLPLIGSHAYAALMRIDDWYKRERVEKRRLANRLRRHLKQAVQFLSDFGDRAVHEAALKHNAQTVICGHSHRAERRMVGSVEYINDGDWVHSLTAVVEDASGELHLIACQADGLRLLSRQTAIASSEASQ